MARNTSVSLGEHFTEFIDSAVESGRYATASDVIRAGLRLLESDSARLNALRAMIDEADSELDREQGIEVNDAFWVSLAAEDEEDTEGTKRNVAESQVPYRAS